MMVGVNELGDRTPDEYAKAVLRAMKNAKIKGKSINVEPANRK